MPRTLTNDERMAKYVDKTDTCWLWLGAKESGGYGQTKINGRMTMAHRWTYEWLIGPVPPDTKLDHLCRVRHCVNPAHLEPVSHQENVRRGLLSYALRTTCVQGHDITDPANLKRRGGSTDLMRCRTCALEAQRRTRYGQRTA